MANGYNTKRVTHEHGVDIIVNIDNKITIHKQISQ